jgi:hypothetical protein
MAGLPHFQNSLSSLNRYEPVYLNQFEVSIIPPSSVAGGPILLEHITSVGGLALDKNPAPTAQKYKFAKRNYAGGKPDSTVMNVTTSFTVNLNDANSMYVFKTLRQWCDLIYNPLTGAMGLKNDYVGTMTISIFNKNGDVFRRIVCKDCFPTKPISSMNLNYTSEEIYKIDNFEWAVDYWEDLFL